MVARWLIPIGMALTFVGCNRPPDSLVGAAKLPSAEELGGETLQLNRFRGTQTEPEMLVAELRPDNALNFTLTRRDLHRGEMVLGKESFKLQPSAADQIRKRLWRLRPGKLEGIQKQVLPIGCDWMFDETPEFTAAFIGPNGKDIGATDVQASCESPAAVASRKLVGEVLKQFPKSKLANGFWIEHQPLR